MFESKRLRIASPLRLSQYDPNQLFDWKLCCLCQTHKKDEPLSNPEANPIESKRKESYVNLGNNILKCRSGNTLPHDVNFAALDNGKGIASTLEIEKAVWHNNCKRKYCTSKIEKKSRKSENKENINPVRQTRMSTPLPNHEDGCCIFCPQRGGKVHFSTDKASVETVKAWAVSLNDGPMIASLCGVQEIKYHLKCRQKYFRRTVSRNTSHEISHLEVCESMAFHDLCTYIREKLADQSTDFLLLTTDLIRMYKERLAEILALSEAELPYTHNSRFRDKILNTFPQLESSKCGRGYILRDEHADISINADDDDWDKSTAGFMRMLKWIHKHMADDTRPFNGSLRMDQQGSTIHPLLFAAVNILLFGTDVHESGKATIPASTIVQLIVQNRRERAPKGDIVRHNKNQEMPVPVYLGLSMFAASRSKSAIDDLHNLGLSISYDRVQEITSSLCHLVVERAKEEGMVCPAALKKGIFTVGAYDNIDHNPTSNTARSSFHGTGISIFQMPSVECQGEARDFSATYENVSCKGRRSVPHLPDSYAVVKTNVLKVQEPTAPTSQDRLTQQMMPSGSLDTQWKSEGEWLTHINSRLGHRDDVSLNLSWAAFHASHLQIDTSPKTISTLLPLWHEDSQSVPMVIHGMNTIKGITKYLNPSQIPVGCGDMPLYALFKKVQWNYPEEFGEEKFFSMCAPFHIEKNFMQVIGHLLEGSGWCSMMACADVTTQTTAETALKVTHVKRARSLHEVSAAVLYSLLYDMYCTAETSLNFDQWTELQASKNPSFKFWLLILNLETMLLTFLQSIRVANFSLYVETLKRMIPWFFIADHHNYARWLPVHARDLEELASVAPSLHEEFTQGKFFVKKSHRLFSRIAVDQAHEQNNAVVKDSGGMIGLTHDPTLLRRVSIAGPEISRLTSEFEVSVERSPKTTSHLHHEQNMSFQRTFKENCIALKDVMLKYGDPFGDQDVLVALDSRIVIEKSGVEELYGMEKKGRLLYETYVRERLVQKSKSVFSRLPKVRVPIFSVKKRTTNVNLDAKYFKSEAELFSRLFIIVQNRDLDLVEFFRHENQTSPPSLSRAGQLNKPQNKSDIVHLLEELLIDERGVPSSCDCIIYDGAALVHANPPRLSSTYQEYMNTEFRQRLTQDTNRFSAARVDLVWDLYKADSLKNATREGRGCGTRRQVAAHLRLPSNWPDFLRNSANKGELFTMLGRYALADLPGGIHVVTNLGETISATNLCRTALSGSPCATSEEADGRIIGHARDMALHGAKSILICTVDSDVVVLAVSFFFDLQALGLQQLWILFGTGRTKRFLPVHHIACHDSLGEEKANALRGFHAFCGCDTVSAFNGKGPKSAMKIWKSVPESTAAFLVLSNPKTAVIEEGIYSLLETFVARLYGAKDTETVDEARKELFMTKTKTLNKLPPTQGALRQHTLRAAFQAGQVWGQAGEVNPDIPCPSDWGWERAVDGWTPRWTTLKPIWEAVRELIRCSCKSGCKADSRCSCRAARIPCAPCCTGCKGVCCNSKQQMDPETEDGNEDSPD